jgi:hypothetical protein
MVDHLKLNEFKALYKEWKTKIPWVDHLLLGLLVWLEEKFIDYRVTTTVDEAIEEYEKLEEPMPDCVTPVYTEKPSEASTRLPEMRLTAPWYIDTKE